MDRYLDNTSPEPTSQTSQIQIHQNCYKTPDFGQFHQSYSGYQYPTPPSDNEDTSIAYQSQQTDISPTVYYNTQSLANSARSSSSSSPDESQSNVNSTVSRYKRRSRTTFSKSQLDVLEQTFQKAQYPEIKVVDDLSTMLNLSTERISIWFQNRRARFKKARKLHSKENSNYLNTDTKTADFKYTPYDLNQHQQGYHQSALYYPAQLNTLTTNDLNKQSSNAHLFQPLAPPSTQSVSSQMLIPSNYSSYYSNQSLDTNYYYPNNYAANTIPNQYMYQC